MIVFIDNYDSFTWNLVHLFEETGAGPIEVVRNDAYDPDALIASRPAAIVISPGPGAPAGAGRIVETIRAAGSIPLLGICLGHQAIAEALGGRVGRGAEPVHGKVDQVRHGNRGLFEGCENPLRAVRYHSLVVSELPEELTVDATTGDGTVMALSHRSRPLFGLQFHPESYATRCGTLIARNFLRMGGVA